MRAKNIPSNELTPDQSTKLDAGLHKWMRYHGKYYYCLNGLAIIFAIFILVGAFLIGAPILGIGGGDISTLLGYIILPIASIAFMSLPAIFDFLPNNTEYIQMADDTDDKISKWPKSYN